MPEPRLLWVTNDLPPGTGGIERFVGELAKRAHPSHALVAGPSHPQAPGWDARQPYRTVRWRGALLPTPAVGRWVEQLARMHRPDAIVLGALWPLGELASRWKARLGLPVIALTHGLEAGIATSGFGWLIRRASRGVDIATTITDWTERRLDPYLVGTDVMRLAPGVDTARYRPDPSAGAKWRRQWNIPRDAPVVGCVSRLVRRKGQDRLVRIWPQVLERHPQARLVIVGDGPIERSLARRSQRSGDRIVCTGGAGWDELPDCYAAFDVFAMPCRTRWGGLDVEGLGIVYLEAQSSGLPVVAGRSGGAPEAVVDGVSGTVVDGRDDAGLVGALDAWLVDEDRCRRAGRDGRAWVVEHWSWEAVAQRFDQVIARVAG